VSGLQSPLAALERHRTANLAIQAAPDTSREGLKKKESWMYSTRAHTHRK
jgi:hypothetical protein